MVVQLVAAGNLVPGGKLQAVNDVSSPFILQKVYSAKTTQDLQKPGPNCCVQRWVL